MSGGAHTAGPDWSVVGPELLRAAEGLLTAYRGVLGYVELLDDDVFSVAADHPQSWASITEAAIQKARPTPLDTENEG